MANCWRDMHAPESWYRLCCQLTHAHTHRHTHTHPHTSTYIQIYRLKTQTHAHTRRHTHVHTYTRFSGVCHNRLSLEKKQIIQNYSHSTERDVSVLKRTEYCGVSEKTMEYKLQPRFIFSTVYSSTPTFPFIEVKWALILLSCLNIAYCGHFIIDIV